MLYFIYMIHIYRKNGGFIMFSRWVTLILFVISTFSPSLIGAYATTLPFMPEAGKLVAVSSPYNPVTLKGIKFNPTDPFKLEFIIDEGNQVNATDASIKEESAMLIRYFLSAVTMPADDMWVNLSPYESDRIIADDVGKTEIGRDMLAQDYVLKQLSASLTYPESDLGKAYWKNVTGVGSRPASTLTQGQAGLAPTTNTFNKIWITPDQSEVYESGSTAVISKSSLKVMTEEDYLAMDKNGVGVGSKPTQNNGQVTNLPLQGSSVSAIKELVLPQLQKDVNLGQNFARLRQLHSAIVLAAWFKVRLKDSLYSSLYIDKKKTNGLNLSDTQIKEKIYNQYLEAFKKGAYNYTKTVGVGSKPTRGQVVNLPLHKVTKRTYFSGGLAMQTVLKDGPAVVSSTADVIAEKLGGGTAGKALTVLAVVLATAGTLSAVLSGTEGTAEAAGKEVATEREKERPHPLHQEFTVPAREKPLKRFISTKDPTGDVRTGTTRAGTAKADQASQENLKNFKSFIVELANGIDATTDVNRVGVSVNNEIVQYNIPQADVKVVKGFLRDIHTTLAPVAVPKTGVSEVTKKLMRAINDLAGRSDKDGALALQVYLNMPEMIVLDDSDAFSVVIGADGPMANTIEGHRDHEEKIGLSARDDAFSDRGVIVQLAQEIDAKPKTIRVDGKEIVVADFAATINDPLRARSILYHSDGSRYLETEYGYVALTTDNIVVIVDNRLTGGHAGRGKYQMAAYASTPEEAEHELSELRDWRDYALRLDGVNTIATQDDIDNGLLGKRIDDAFAVRPTLIDVKWAFHINALEKQAQSERWSDERLRIAKVEATEKRLKETASRPNAQQAQEVLGAIRARIGAIKAMIARAPAEQITGLQGELATAKEVLKKLDQTADRLRNARPSITISSDGNSGDNGEVGGITEKGLTVKINGDGSRIPMFKGAPLDIANFTGFDFTIASMSRHKTGRELVMAR
jgi:hypothetical protein